MRLGTEVETRPSALLPFSGLISEVAERIMVVNGLFGAVSHGN